MLVTLPACRILRLCWNTVRPGYGEPRVLSNSSGCLVSTGSLPFLIDDIGQPISAVFATQRKSYNYILEIAARDLQYREYTDDRVANVGHDIISE